MNENMARDFSMNDIFTLGKAYASFGDGQFDQGIHLLLDNEKFKPLLDDIVGVTSDCPGHDECICGELSMGAVETFILQRYGVIEVNWSEKFLEFKGRLNKTK